MKYINIVVLGLVLVFLGVDIYMRWRRDPCGCCASGRSADRSDQVQVADTALSLNSMPIDTAKSNIRRYRELLALEYKRWHPLAPERDPQDSLFAYTVHAMDMLGAMGLPIWYARQARFSAVRFYLGLDHRHRFKVMLTPVQGSDFDRQRPGTDYILPDNTRQNRMATGYVLDLNAPCPLTCDGSSPLNTETASGISPILE